MGEQNLIQAPVCVLAVDPGLSGAVCRLGGGHFDVRRDFKTLKDITIAIRDLAGDVTQGVIEFVHSRPGQGVRSMFSFGLATGVAKSALWSWLQAPVEEVAPQAWQGFFRGLLRVPRATEFDARAVAAKILPSSVPYLSRVKDHNSADAILMAAWKLLAS